MLYTDKPKQVNRILQTNTVEVGKSSLSSNRTTLEFATFSAVRVYIRIWAILTRFHQGESSSNMLSLKVESDHFNRSEIGTSTLEG